MSYQRPAIEPLGDAQMSEVMGSGPGFGFGWFVPFLSITFPFGTGGPVVIMFI